MLGEVEGKHRVEHRHLNPLPPAGAFAVQQGSQDGLGVM
jgi:hypothetical protein